MATYIVTEDFIYPRDKHNHEYGCGWSLLNNAGDSYGREAWQCKRTRQESYQRIFEFSQNALLTRFLYASTYLKKILKTRDD